MSLVVYHFYISILSHVDPWNDNDIQFDICAVDSILLSSIHETVIKTLNLQNVSKLYYKTSDNTILDQNKTLKELGIDANCTIYLDRISSKRIRDEMVAPTNNATISIYVSTKVSGRDGTTTRKIKMICREQDDFGTIIDELSDTLENNGLRYKFGRSFLKAGKTLGEQGLYDGSEIIAVRGRA